MTDTGQVPGDGQPGNAGMVEQQGLPAPGAYTFPDSPETPAEDDDLLLMPGAQGAWSEPQQAQGQPQFQAQFQPQAAAQLPEPGAHETGGRDSGSVDVGAVRAQAGAQPTPPPRRPLHMGPPVPDATGGVVRSLADRGPTMAPPQPAPVSDGGPQTLGPEYLDFPRDEAEALPGPQLGEIPPQAVPWTPQPEPVAQDPAAAVQPGTPAQTPRSEPQPEPQSHDFPADQVGPAETVVPEPVASQVQAAPAPVLPEAPAEPAAQDSMGRFVPVEGSLPSAPHLAPTPAAAMTAPEAPLAEQPVAEAAPGAGQPAGPQPEAVPAGSAVPVPEAESPSVAEPVAEPVAEQAAGPAPGPVAEPVTEPVAESAPEAVAAPAPEPVPQAQPEPVGAAAEAEAAAAGTGVVEPESAVAPVPAAESVPIEAGEQLPRTAAVAPVPAPRRSGAAEQQVPAAEPQPDPAGQAAPQASAGPAEAQAPVDAPADVVADEPVAHSAAAAVAPAAAAPAEAAAPAVEPPAAAAVETEAAAEAVSAPEAAEPATPVPAAEPVPAPEARPFPADAQPEPAAVAEQPVAEQTAEARPVAAAAPVQEQPAEAQPATEQPGTEPPGPEQQPAENADQQPTEDAEAADTAEQQQSAEGEAEPVTAAAPGYDDAEREAVLRVMRERRDIRNGFRSDPIPHEVLLRVLEAAHTAPSVGHSQPWDFVVIRSAETRRSMHELAQRQREAYAKSLPKGRAKQFKELKIEAILDTPVNIVVTADPTRGGRHTLGRHTQPQMAPYSSALAVENLWLAARAEGLGVGWVSFFDEREMVRALGLPEHLEVVAYLCVGYVDEFPEEPELMQAGWSKRRPLSWVVHEETYGRRALPGEDPHDLLQDTITNIRPLDAKALGEAWDRQKRMTKPAGALGMLEIISAQLSGLSRMCPPPIPEPAAVAIFAGDHGVYAQGVTAWPQEVTCQMVANFLGGGAVCNAFANQVGAEVCVVDVGVAGELPATPGLLPRKVRAGTGDFTTGPALTREEVLSAIEVGIETARDLVAAGNKVLLTGEMGIANTTVSAALICVYTGQDPSEVTGRGTGINDEMHARKVDVVRRGLELHRPDPADPIGVLAAVGGLEHAALAGFLLGGASLRTPVILDGVSAGAAALVARAIAPEALAACIAGHRSAEPGHVAALNKLGLRPLVDLDLRLGEGTGALLALPVVQSAARAMHEVATFDSAGVTEK
ncbi:nicotinate-nucleotide--dimethylbenzimidazole phosphoribosyltransferase [Streptomyces sp. NBC_00144]|uniref:nicotinate-nucleotide--dimethylbenzimidazole phosphoribosyltransferase n=1 Tax=Streptomyces sp. NBC_00144 TaxID=2975665 RepID=UPI0032521C68